MGEERLSCGTRKINPGEDTQGNDLTMNANDATEQLHREIALHRVKQKLEKFQTNVVSEVQKKIESMVEDVVQEMFAYELNASQFKDFAKQQSNHIWSNRIHAVGSGKDNRIEDKNVKRKLPDKVFLPRQSYLTSLLEVKHMKGIYNIFFVIFTVIFMNLFIHDFIVEGSLNIGLRTIRAGFGKFHFTLALWGCMEAIVLGLYYGFKVWAEVRFLLRTNKSLQTVWNYFCLVIFISFQMSFGFIFPVLCVKLDLPLGGSSIILLDMIRLMMKMHSFVRTNAAIQLSGKLKIDDDADQSDEDNHIPVPGFSKYTYFLFAPTLIYRDNYPRTKQIHWRFVMKNALELIAVIFFISFLHERYIRPYFGNFGKQEITIGHLVVTLFGMVAPGLMIYLCGFYCILHITQNLVGELIRFADRMFYKDWWTANNLEAYFRDWNIIVHDWLYEYIYKDFYMYVFKGNKSACGTAVIIISAIVHEYLIAFAFRFVYPVLLVMFGVITLTLLRIVGKSNSSIGNFFLWWSLGVGNGLMVSLYAMEYYARQNCPVGDSFWDYFVPVSWWCNGITSVR